MKFKILTFTLISAVFIGCSGKVQTNKLPDDKKWNIPNQSSGKSQMQISEELIKDYDEFACKFFGCDRKPIAVKPKVATATKKIVPKKQAVKKTNCGQPNTAGQSITQKTDCFNQIAPTTKDDYYYKSNVYEMGLDRGHFNE